MGESLPSNLEVHPKKYEDKKKTKKQRCHQCKQKTGLLSFTCQCGHIFCVAHQSCHAHNCTYNRTTLNQKNIKDKNPCVKPAKLEKI